MANKTRIAHLLRIDLIVGASSNQAEGPNGLNRRAIRRIGPVRLNA
jgi:hypothetical protein